MKKLGLDNNAALADELLKRVKVFNYVVMKKADVNAVALVAEF